jgi:hypothetical protein
MPVGVAENEAAVKSALSYVTDTVIGTFVAVPVALLVRLMVLPLVNIVTDEPAAAWMEEASAAAIVVGVEPCPKPAVPVEPYTVAITEPAS